MADPAPLTGEASNHKVAAVFASAEAARAAAAALQSTLRLPAAQLRIISPGEPHPGRKLEPESDGILRTILVSHLKLGVVGAALGGVAFAVLYALDLPWVTQSAPVAAAVMVGFGATAGLLLGGLVSLRPDHDPYIEAVRSALAEGRSAVVVHATSVTQRAEAAELLQARGAETTSTL